MKPKNLGFNVQEKRGFVSYTGLSNGRSLFGVARFDNNGPFHTEIGKALAYARFELEVRRAGIQDAKNVCYAIEDLLEHSDYYDEKGIASILSSHLNIAYDYLNSLKQYYTNQKKMVKLLERNTDSYIGYQDYHKILQDIHDKICGPKKSK